MILFNTVVVTVVFMEVLVTKMIKTTTVIKMTVRRCQVAHDDSGEETLSSLINRVHKVRSAKLLTLSFP